ncbi:hypothetical protein PLEOSDRAFT_1081195 [Pleurotus ostreatus PC15]|uniref:Uncharacterized protein n=1 Tax=Pleurotus ostreatus (strain PC15) TaxID=1137138 RepID=A0A067P742_PLEO1|nr:hypothetical protein PLEOSDRAFT_1081195 [Pleurotus ostreatus PC15]
MWSGLLMEGMKRTDERVMWTLGSNEFGLLTVNSPQRRKPMCVIHSMMQRWEAGGPGASHETMPEVECDESPFIPLASVNTLWKRRSEKIDEVHKLVIWETSSWPHSLFRLERNCVIGEGQGGVRRENRQEVIQIMFKLSRYMALYYPVEGFGK